MIKAGLTSVNEIRKAQRQRIRWGGPNEEAQ